MVDTLAQVDSHTVANSHLMQLAALGTSVQRLTLSS
jgi:hypothetical protein